MVAVDQVGGVEGQIAEDELLGLVGRKGVVFEHRVILDCQWRGYWPVTIKMVRRATATAWSA